MNFGQFRGFGFDLVNFGDFQFCSFEVWVFLIKILLFWGFSIFFLVKFCLEVGMRFLDFFLRTMYGLFFKFISSIFFLSFWGFLFVCVKFCQGRRRGICLSSCEI